MDIRRKKIIKASVRASIDSLLAKAGKAYESGKAVLSKRYVHMAFDLLRKHKAKLPKELRNSFCRKCESVWIPGLTMTASYDRKNNCLRARCRCGYSKRL